MPLHGAEIGRLRDLLASHFTLAELEDLLVNSLGKSLADFTPNQTPRDFAYEIVTKASRGGWDKGLIFHALVARPGVRELEVFANIQASAGRPNAIFPPGYLPRNELHTCFVGERHPFIDRESLRVDIAGMLDQPEPRILVLEGPEGIGKSYAASFVRVIHRTRADFDLATVEINRLGPKVHGCTPEKLVDEIARQVEGLRSAISSPEAGAQQTRQHDSVLDDLREVLAEWPRELWIVLDGFEDVVLRQETTEAIQSIIGWANGLFKDRLRVLLVGAGEHLDVTAWPLVQLEDLGKTHVEGFFKDLFEDFGKQLPAGALALALGDVESQLENASYSDPEGVFKALRATLVSLSILQAEG